MDWQLRSRVFIFNFLFSVYSYFKVGKTGFHPFLYHFRTFLFGRDGNPNKRNVHNETSMHLLCMGPQIMISEGALHPRLARPAEDDSRRADCLQMILRWKGAKLDQGEYERAAIDAIDNKKNTPLHYAAASGMRTCVEVKLRSFNILHGKICVLVICNSQCFFCLYLNS